MMSHFLYRQCYFQAIKIETFLKYQFLFVVQLQMKQTKLFLQASYLCFIHNFYPLFYQKFPLFIYPKHNTNQIFRFNPYFSKFPSSKFLKFSSISGSSLEWERHRILIPTLVSPYQVLHVFGFFKPHFDATVKDRFRIWFVSMEHQGYPDLISGQKQNHTN